MIFKCFRFFKGNSRKSKSSNAKDEIALTATNVNNFPQPSFNDDTLPPIDEPSTKPFRIITAEEQRIINYSDFLAVSESEKKKTESLEKIPSITPQLAIASNSTNDSDPSSSSIPTLERVTPTINIPEQPQSYTLRSDSLQEHFEDTKKTL
ncbi:hypothetical protein G9A89_014294 [Geosiphon pyriformis]|nr:hypothetical protein G9A89_014294 [Geosiphon pyriformis]